MRFGQHTLFTTVTDTLKADAPVGLDRQRRQLFLVEPSSAAIERSSNEFFGIHRVSKKLVAIRALLLVLAILVPHAATRGLVNITQHLLS